MVYTRSKYRFGKFNSRKKFENFQPSLICKNLLFGKFCFKCENLLYINKLLLFFCKENKILSILFPKKMAYGKLNGKFF